VIGALAVHYLYGGVRLQGAGDRMSIGARAHLTSLIALFVLLKAVAYFLDRRAMLLEYNGGTDTWGAGYTDINAVLPAKEILTYISIVGGDSHRDLLERGHAQPRVGWASTGSARDRGDRDRWHLSIGVQQFTVKPNVRDKEADYIARSIQNTRQAYGIANVERTQYNSQNETPPASLATDRTVVPTIRLLDPAVVNETYTQYQQIRSFYDFPEKLDVDRYVIDGRLQDFVVGVREINYNKLTGQQTNWQNRHTVFTHGFGFVAAPANTICDGAPYFVSGLIGTSEGNENSSKCVAPADTIKVDEPRIYYGELAGPDDYVVLGKQPGATDIEFDRPAGESQQTYSYTGTGGVPVNSMLRRILYGLHFWEPNFLLSDVFNENSKVMYVRNPRERVERVAPFLTMDGDPYPAVINGRVTWILDGYTTSSSYPYSQVVDLRSATSDTTSDRGTVLQAKQNINYIRNSVKATVDAYDGKVTLYSFDDNDPILKAWNKAFGNNIIKPRSEIPPELAAHFRYPEDLFKVQRDLISKFHVSDPKQFNSGQDFWAVPDDPATAPSGAVGLKQPPYFLLTQFPGLETSRFQLTAALTPTARQNLSALLTGVLTDQGPKLELLELPREGRIPGPGQAQQQMVNDNDVRGRITLLSGQGQAQVVYGNLLSLPYAGGLLYVQPVYVKSNVANAYPLMRLVLVSFGSTVGFSDTLGGAIQELVKKGQGQPITGQPPPNNGQPPTTGQNPVVSSALLAAAAKVDAAITKVQQAQASGDFAAYGEALAELQAAMNEFKAAQAAAGSAVAHTDSVAHRLAISADLGRKRVS
jgi:uncharacterized membrane protein (UPF0182 family)